jgi:hypothetical protein
MNTYTVIVYVRPAGAHHLEVVEANDATIAVVRLRERLLLAKEECEVLAVASGRVDFECVDAAEVALAPYCAPTVV